MIEVTAKTGEAIRQSGGQRITHECGAFLGVFHRGATQFWCKRCRKLKWVVDTENREGR